MFIKFDKKKYYFSTRRIKFSNVRFYMRQYFTPCKEIESILFPWRKNFSESNETFVAKTRYKILRLDFRTFAELSEPTDIRNGLSFREIDAYLRFRVFLFALRVPKRLYHSKFSIDFSSLGSSIFSWWYPLEYFTFFKVILFQFCSLQTS